MSLTAYMAAQPHTPAEEEERRQSRERQLAALAARQHGVVDRGQLIALGLTTGAIERRLRCRRLVPLHRGVYAVGHGRLSRRGTWMAAVLACGEGRRSRGEAKPALLSHHSAAALWGLIRPVASPVDVTSPRGRPGRKGIRLHRGRIHPEDRKLRDLIPVTSVARTLFDFAEAADRRSLERAFEEAERLRLLDLTALERVCARGPGRRAQRPIRDLLSRERSTGVLRSPLESDFGSFCREHGLPSPATNAYVLGLEVDAVWPVARLVVELDGFAYHGHRAAFERDRKRDAALQVAGYRVLRLTHRRIASEPAAVAAELRRLLGAGG